MGLIVEPISPDGCPRPVTYVRLDGLRLDARPLPTPQGRWQVPADRSIFVHLYGYADVAARMRGDAPIFDTPMTITFAELGLAGIDDMLGTMAPQEIWDRLYATLKAGFGHAIDEYAKLLG